MSRKLTYNINRFDGGITDNIRETSDLSKCSHISHFDIYDDPYTIHPMPGYIADQDTVAGGTDDLQNYNIKAFDYDGTLYAVGTKLNGTGSKVFSKANAETASWTADGSEGTDDLASNTFLNISSSGRLYFVTNAGGQTYLSYHQKLSTTTDKATTLQTSITELPHVIEYAFDDINYFNTGFSDIGKIVSSTVTDPVKTTAAYVTDIQSGDEQLGILGFRFFPYKVQLLLWDSGSSLLDQKIEFGKGRNSILGYPSGVWVAAISENLVPSTTFNEEANGEYSLVLKYAAAAGGARTLLRLPAVTNTNGALFPVRGQHKDAMLFYARIPQDATPTTYKEGIWAVGRATDNSPLAASLLLDTSSLGSIEGHYTFGKHHFFAHNNDGSVSRLDAIDSGTYDVNAVYESLMFGSDSPEQKSLNGISVVTEGLPSGGVVEVSYRTDENDAWTSMGSSSTDGAEKHSFTKKSDATPIGKFQEVMFKVEVTGNVKIKNIKVTLLEEDNLSYDA